MELELRPRRSPFETGNTKASLATPSCCCCCCCLNALGAASGIIGADTKARARNAGRSDNGARWFGILGFLFLPLLLFLAVIVSPLVPQGDGAPVIPIVLAIVVFVAATTGLRALANPDDAFSLNGFGVSVAAAVIVVVVSLVEVFVTVFSGGISLLLSPFSAWGGWKMAASAHGNAGTPDASQPPPLDQSLDAPAPTQPSDIPLAGDDPEQSN